MAIAALQGKGGDGDGEDKGILAAAEGALEGDDGVIRDGGVDDSGEGHPFRYRAHGEEEGRVLALGADEVRRLLPGCAYGADEVRVSPDLAHGDDEGRRVLPGRAHGEDEARVLRGRADEARVLRGRAYADDDGEDEGILVDFLEAAERALGGDDDVVRGGGVDDSGEGHPFCYRAHGDDAGRRVLPGRVRGVDEVLAHDDDELRRAHGEDKARVLWGRAHADDDGKDEGILADFLAAAEGALGGGDDMVRGGGVDDSGEGHPFCYRAHGEDAGPRVLPGRARGVDEVRRAHGEDKARVLRGCADEARVLRGRTHADDDGEDEGILAYFLAAAEGAFGGGDDVVRAGCVDDSGEGHSFRYRAHGEDVGRRVLPGRARGVDDVRGVLPHLMRGEDMVRAPGDDDLRLFLSGRAHGVDKAPGLRVREHADEDIVAVPVDVLAAVGGDGDRPPGAPPPVSPAIIEERVRRNAAGAQAAKEAISRWGLGNTNQKNSKKAPINNHPRVSFQKSLDSKQNGEMYSVEKRLLTGNEEIDNKYIHLIDTMNRIINLQMEAENLYGEDRTDINREIRNLAIEMRKVRTFLENKGVYTQRIKSEYLNC